MSEVGVRNSAKAVVRSGFIQLPLVYKGWAQQGKIFFKGERGTLNVGLQGNPSIFNKNLIEFSVVK